MDSIEGLNIKKILEEPLKDRIMPETRIPEYREPPREVNVDEEDLVAMGLVGPKEEAPMIDQLEEQLKKAEDDQRALAIAEQQQQVTIQVGQQPQQQIMMPQQQMMMPQQETMMPEQQPVMMPQQQMMMPQQQGTQVKIQIPQGVQIPTTSAQGVQTMGPIGMPMDGGDYSNLPIPQPIVYNNPLPQQQHAPTIVIDTGTNAMAASGFMREEQLASRGINTMGGRRHTTPRARSVTPSRATKPTATIGGQSVSASSKVMVKKLE